jgi:hypothetical protein
LLPARLRKKRSKRVSYHADDWRDRWESPDDRERPDPYHRDRRRRQEAHSVLIGPAICMIVLAVINLIGALGLLGGSGFLLSMSAQEFQEMMTEDDPHALDDVINNGWTVDGFRKAYGYTVLGLGLVSGLATLILGAGGFAMLYHKLYGLAVAAAVTAILSPGGFCVFGLGAGIWSLVALANPEERQSFT